MLDYYLPPEDRGFEQARYAPEILRRSSVSAGHMPAVLLDISAEQYAEELLGQSSVISSHEALTRLPAYRRLLALGENAVPALLRQLTREEFSVAALSLLEEITGCDPVRDEHIGRPRGMRDDWVAWGEQRGLI